ncbi:MAG: anaerobic glycerol-3-phosphate dehydrogenase subunit C [Fuerstiella sp.]|nr:anaerobic glycerol-3-phosphate dehydrogenase subunit C [Fuerstiella sp.]
MLYWEPMAVEDVHRRIFEELPDLLEGEICTDPVTTALYSTDASLHQIEPVAVAFPQSAADVETLAIWASDNSVPLIPRGAGTGLAGGALGRGIVIDFSRHMTRVLEVGSHSVRVQPGVIHADLNALLRPHGCCFAPSSSRSAYSTIGGMLAVDAAGAQAIRVGSVRDHVMEVDCVLIGGQRVTFSDKEPIDRRFAIRQPVSPRMTEDTLRESGELFLPPVHNETLSLTRLLPLSRRSDILERLVAVLDESADQIESLQPVMLRNSCGYMLRGVRRSNSLDVTRLLAGSEGTLGIFTEATLHLMPIPKHRALAAIMFGTTDDALRAMQLLLDLSPSACDLLDRRLLSVARESRSNWASVVHQEAEAGLFLEFTASGPGEIRQRVAESESRLRDAGISHIVTQIARTESDVDNLWQLPLQAGSLLARLKGASLPLPFVEDIAVPPAEISQFLTLAQKTFQRHEVTATMSAHAASGQLHLRPMLPFPDSETASRIEALARDLYHHVRAVGGTISGQNGDGLSRTAFIRSQYGGLYRVFQQVKDIFDPQRLLNPDKVISDDGQLTIRHLRKTRVSSAATSNDQSVVQLPVLNLTWSAEQAMQTANHCDGCGECRSTAASLRMCPFFHQQSSEIASPRSKATLIRTALATGTSEELLTNEVVQELADSCFNCRQCQLECPSGVDIPHLVLETRAQFVSANGLSRTDWLLSQFHRYARFASRFTRLTNRLLRHRIFRRVLQKTLGIAEKRRLPRYARRTFLNSAVARRECSDGRPGDARRTVVYFVDYFANHHDPELATAFVRILQYHGFRVYVPPGQTVSGMAMVSVGDIDSAREVAETNVRELGEPAREGFPILCTEPSAALCLKQEYPLLVDHPDTGAVAEQTQDAGSFLLDLHVQGRLRTNFQEIPLRLIYHTPCHLKAVSDQRGLMDLMRLIPGVEVSTIDQGCTGMAGTFGIAAEHFEQSLQIGDPLLQSLKTVNVSAGLTECSSCRMQMEQTVNFPTLHPIKILALAWGLMPGKKDRLLNSRPSGLLMS